MGTHVAVAGIAAAFLISVRVCGGAIPYPTPAATVVIGSGTREEYLVGLPDGEPRLIFRSDRPPFLMWSPQGDRFAYVLDGQLLVVDPNDPLRPIARASVGQQAYPIGWSHEAGIVVKTADMETVTISVVDSVSGETRRIFTTLGRSADTSFVAWLDEGRALFQETASGLANLVVYDFDSGERTVTGIDLIGLGAGPAISPDHRTIAWNDHCGYPGTNDGIWIADVESWVPRRVSDACGLTDIAWSPDSSELAFTAEYTTVHETPEGTGGLYVINLPTAETRRLTHPSPTASSLVGRVVQPLELEVEWLPGGAGFRVLRDIARCFDCRGARSFLISPDGSAEAPITNSAMDSRDGVGELRLTDSGLTFSAADGSASRLLLEAEEGWALSGRFSPTGQWATVSHDYCPMCLELN